MFQRILFPVDLSDQCRRAAPFVKAFAERFHSQLVLLHVSVLTPPEGAAWVDALAVGQAQEARRSQFESFLADDFRGVDVRRQFTEGDPALEIPCYARANNVGLIMMPTHGYGPFRSFLLGSVTAKVLHDVECPVWTGVHQGELTSHDPKRLRRILCCVDKESADVSVIRWAAKFGKEVGAELSLVHVIPGDPEVHASTDPVFREQIFTFAQAAVERLQAEAGTSLDLTLRLGKPAHVVHEVAQYEQADLVIVGRGAIQKAMGRLRSTAYGIIRESPCPVISI